MVDLNDCFGFLVSTGRAETRSSARGLGAHGAAENQIEGDGAPLLESLLTIGASIVEQVSRDLEIEEEAGDRVDVEVDGYRVRVHIDGNSGPVVVLCSGLGGRQLHWSDTVADLARDHTVVRFDRPGTPAAGTPTVNARRTVRGEAARIA